MKRRCTFWMDEWQGDALKEIKERDGIPEAEQIRRALNAWIESKGIAIEGQRGRTRARKGGQ